MAYFPDDQIELRPSLGQVCSRHGQEIQRKSQNFEENDRKSKEFEEKSGSEVDLGRRGWPALSSSRKACQREALGVGTKMIGFLVQKMDSSRVIDFFALKKKNANFRLPPRASLLQA